MSDVACEHPTWTYLWHVEGEWYTSACDECGEGAVHRADDIEWLGGYSYRLKESV